MIEVSGPKSYSVLTACLNDKIIEAYIMIQEEDTGKTEPEFQEYHARNGVRCLIDNMSN
ncbi:MAG: hypothetical protein GX240_03245 [Candidatus Atribacteria bacterium]|nr:hypothetical protein [Candidatus Atribacteria bacterium]